MNQYIWKLIRELFPNILTNILTVYYIAIANLIVRNVVCVYVVRRRSDRKSGKGAQGTANGTDGVCDERETIHNRAAL